MVQCTAPGYEEHSVQQFIAHCSQTAPDADARHLPLTRCAGPPPAAHLLGLGPGAGRTPAHIHTSQAHEEMLTQISLAGPVCQELKLAAHQPHMLACIMPLVSPAASITPAFARDLCERKLHETTNDKPNRGPYRPPCQQGVCARLLLIIFCLLLAPGGLLGRCTVSSLPACMI